MDVSEEATPKLHSCIHFLYMTDCPFDKPEEEEILEIIIIIIIIKKFTKFAKYIWKNKRKGNH